MNSAIRWMAENHVAANLLMLVFIVGEKLNDAEVSAAAQAACEQCGGLQLAFFYRTPILFAYDPFVGYFSGALYDTVLDHDGLLAYRAASAAAVTTTRPSMPGEPVSRRQRSAPRPPRL